MPFDRTAPELDAGACRLILHYVHERYPRQYQDFIDSTRKTEQEWGRTVIVSHTDFLALAENLYTLAGKKDPEVFFDAGMYLAYDKRNPTVRNAWMLGSPSSVIAAAALGLNPKLNKDSRIRVPFLETNHALVEHFNLGASSNMYWSAITSTIGYFRAIPTLWNRKPLDATVRMVEMRLEDILEQDYPQIKSHKDSQGNLLIDGEIVARAVWLDDTTYSHLPFDHPIYQLKKDIVELKLLKGSYIVGDLHHFNGKIHMEDVDLVSHEDIRLFETTRDVIVNGVRAIIGGTIYGGETPAPCNIYELKWEEHKNLRERLWFFLVKTFSKSSGGQAVQVMNDIAKQEAVRAAVAEREAERLREELAERTRRAIEERQKRNKDKVEVQGQLHDIAHFFDSIYFDGTIGRVHIIDLVLPHLTANEESELLNILEMERRPNTFQEFKEGLVGNTSKAYTTEDVNYIYNKLFGILERKGGDPLSDQFYSWLREYESWWNRFVSNLQRYEKVTRTVMDTYGTDRERFRPVNYRSIWDSVFKDLKFYTSNVLMKIELPEDICLEGDMEALALCCTNLLDNALEAARAKQYPEISIKAQISSAGLETIVENSGADVPDDVITKLNFPQHKRFSTKRGDKGGVGTLNIKETLHSHGANIQYSKRDGGGVRATILFPGEIVTERPMRNL